MSWFKKPLNIGLTVGAALLAVTVIFLIVWGVMHHTEGGMLEVCWTDDGQAQYVSGAEDDHGPCEGSEELVWSQEQIPLTLAPTTADGEPMAQDAREVRVLSQAIADLNSQVSFELFRMGSGLRSASAEVRFGGAFLRGTGRVVSPPPGYVSHIRMGAGKTLSGRVYIRSDVGASDRYLYLVLEHELLHLIGLAHDNFPDSIMFPITREEGMSGKMSTAHVTDLDVSNLQRRYRQSE